MIYRLGAVKMGKYLNYFVLTTDGDKYNVCSYTFDENVVAENYWKSLLLKDKLIVEQWIGLGATDKFKDYQSLLNWYNALAEFEDIIYFPPYEEEDL
jgi:hypothetical protein